MKWKYFSTFQQLLLISLLFLISGTLINAQTPTVKLRTLETAPGQDYLIKSNSNGVAEWTTGGSGGEIEVNLVSIAYIPTFTGNSSNLNQVVIDPNGDIWIIDSTGDAMKMETVYDGSETIIIAGANVAITGTGKTGDPYVINASVTGGGGTDLDSITTMVYTNDTLSITLQSGQVYKTEIVGGGGGPDTLYLSISPGDGVALTTGDSIMILAAQGLDATRNTQQITISPDFSEFAPYVGQFTDTTQLVIHNTTTNEHRRISANQLFDYFIDGGPGSNLGIRVEVDYSGDDANTDYLRGVSPIDSLRLYGYDGASLIEGSSNLWLRAGNGVYLGGGGTDSIILLPSVIPLNNSLDPLLGIDPVSGKIQQRAVSTLSNMAPATSSITLSNSTKDTVNFNSLDRGIFHIECTSITSDTIYFTGAIDGGNYTLDLDNITTDTIKWPDNLLDANEDTLFTRRYTEGKFISFYYDGTNYFAPQALGDLAIDTTTGGGAFQPDSLSGLLVWLDAAVGVTESGGFVTDWADQSGSANHASQATSGYRPTKVSSVINSLPVIRFDGTDDNMSIATNLLNTAGSDATVFFVAKSNSSTAAAVLLANRNDDNGGTDGYIFDYFRDTTLLYAHISATPNIFDTLSTGGFHIVGYERDGLNVRTFHDSNIQASATTLSGYTADSGTKTYIAGSIASGGGISAPLNGDIAEIIVYNRVLSGTERGQVDTYLSSKYNITIP